jgi:hypothetical protein
MRQLVIDRLTAIIEDCGYINRHFECEINECIRAPSELEELSDEELLDAFEASVGFNG